MQTYVKKIHCIIVSLLIKDFCCSKNELVRIEWENQKVYTKISNSLYI
jgi:hypothetical protein